MTFSGIPDPEVDLSDVTPRVTRVLVTAFIALLASLVAPAIVVAATFPGPAEGHRQPQWRSDVRGSSGGLSSLSHAAARMPTVRRGSLLSGDARVGARKAEPVTRGQELGLRFRPDDRDSTQGQLVLPSTGLAPGGGMGSQDQTPFRPVQPRRKPTYEELQADTGTALPPQPMMAYPPLSAPPLPVYPPIFPPTW